MKTGSRPESFIGGGADFLVAADMDSPVGQGERRCKAVPGTLLSKPGEWEALRGLIQRFHRFAATLLGFVTFYGFVWAFVARGTRGLVRGPDFAASAAAQR